MQASNTKNKKGVIKVVAFTTIVVLIMSIFSYVLNPERFLDSTAAYEREQYLSAILQEEENTIDVLILGDSESFGVLSPMHLWRDNGITSFMAGQGGLRTVEEYYSLKKILKKQKPKLVIIETNNVFDNMGMLPELKYDLATTIYYYVPLIKYHGLWKNYFEEDKLDKMHYCGFEIRPNIMPYTGEDYKVYSDEVEPIDKLIKHYFDKTIELCKKNNIEILLVNAPSPQHFTYPKHNAMVKYAKELNVPFIDMNLLDELNISMSDDMLDGGDHVNVYGTVKMTKYLQKYLKDNYELPDRRGDEKYKVWDERAKKFFEELSKY
ncbi:MAG: SGNH/GDSL hydrolase family protein [Lachnospiraceae bacterium]|nr:SGNH/GDSL hydrolase family protein [Lachnospiraceae bacterium]